MQAANSQPRFALGGGSSAFGQYNEGSTGNPLQQPSSRFLGVGGQAPAKRPALFKRGAQQQESEESMSQQPQISSSSDGAGQTAEASAALQSLYEMARSSQQDGASSRAPHAASRRRNEKEYHSERSPNRDYDGVLILRLMSSTMAAKCQA